VEGFEAGILYIQSDKYPAFLPSCYTEVQDVMMTYIFSLCDSLENYNENFNLCITFLNTLMLKIR
jgi:hypothetical protein